MTLFAERLRSLQAAGETARQVGCAAAGVLPALRALGRAAQDALRVDQLLLLEPGASKDVKGSRLRQASSSDLAGRQTVDSSTSDLLADQGYVNVLTAAHFLLRFMKTFDGLAFGQLMNALLMLRLNILSPAELVREVACCVLCCWLTELLTDSQFVRVRYIVHSATVLIPSAAAAVSSASSTDVAALKEIVAYPTRHEAVDDFLRLFVPEPLRCHLLSNQKA